MDWTTVYAEMLTDHAFLAAPAEVRGAWISCVGAATKRETGGVLAGAAKWTDRDWRNVAGISRDLARATIEEGLLIEDGDDIRVAHYDTDRETKYQESKARNANNAKSRWSGNASRMPVVCESHASGNADLRSEEIRDQRSEIPPNPPLGGTGEPLRLTVEPEPESRPRRGSADYSPDFLAFWAAYPRKEGKGAAWRAWRKLRPPLDAVLAALKWQVVSAKWREDNGQYIPHPASYLNATRWEDERPIASAVAPVGKSAAVAATDRLLETPAYKPQPWADNPNASAARGLLGRLGDEKGA